MVAPVKITVGSPVWVKDKVSAWVEGEVTLIEDDDVKFMIPKEKTVWTEAVVTSKMQVKRLGTTSETVVPDKSGVLSKDPKAPELSVLPRDTKAPPEGVADLIELSHLHEPLILQNLANRYKNDNTYTYAGNILIAINPCKKMLRDLYDDGMMQKYKEAKTKDPYVFAVADNAYRSMIEEGKSNSIVVSGESGAGKTETTKRLMTYLAHMGKRSETEETTIEEKLLQSTPVLEAFGNAKTERNNNSSRFGKYVEIQFDDKGRISGADIKTYLLERSRVCRISNPERNYNCFYHVFGAPREDIKKYRLNGIHAKSFHYLNQSNCYELDGVNDAQEYLKTRKAMKSVGICEEEQEAIFRVVAAILHLGNIEFAVGREPKSSVIKDGKSKSHLKVTAILLMCKEDDLEKALTNRVMKAEGKEILQNLELDAAALSRDGLARTIYARLFDWLVEKINNSIGKVPNSESKSIGLLDIYGFEKLEKNSFEQFCINYANEKLQKHFNEHVLESERKVYKPEGIEWSVKEFVGNEKYLKAIKESERIIARLDETSRLRKSYHEASALPKDYTDTNFTIDQYYAEKVTYEAKEFLEKNQDYVVPEHKRLLIHSDCPFIRGKLFPQPRENKASEGNPIHTISIGTGFKDQLQDLIRTLEDAQPHYIKCVKPNDELKPDNFQMSNISKQLHRGGVFEAIQVFCAGYPTRHIFEEFLKRYDIRPEVLGRMNCKKKDACKMILDMVGLEGYKIGETKVFLRNGVLAELDARMAPTKNAARGDLAKKLYKYLGQWEVPEVEKLKTLLQSERQMAKEIKAKNEELREKLKDAKDEFEKANTDALAKVDQLKKSEALLTKKLEDADGKEALLNKKLGDANGEVYQLKQSKASLNKKLEDANGEVSQLKQSKASLNKKFEYANSEVSQLKRSKASLNKKLEDANGEVYQLKRSKASLNKKLEDANSEVSQLKQSKASLNKKLENANGEVYQLTKSKASLNKKLENANGEVYQLKKSKASLTKNLEHANSEVDKLKKSKALLIKQRHP